MMIKKRKYYGNMMNLTIGLMNKLKEIFNKIEIAGISL